tara:strand:- start:172 stop:1119 length:948 start_codon:yes stop_codon:yes gene_type:complete
MIVICFQKNILAGGLGDRINGLMSCYVISKLLKKPFYILWNKENIHKYIDYSKYDFEKNKLTDEENYSMAQFSMIDVQDTLKEKLMNENPDSMFLKKVNLFYTNQEWSQYLFKNKNFLHENYYDNIFAAYKSLYTDILKPTEYLLEKINSYTNNKNNIIGIQIRCGDKYMMCGTGVVGGYVRVTNPEQEIKTMLEGIKKHIEETKETNDYNIFLTSDYFNIYKIGCELFDKERIIYINDVIQHIDRVSLTDDFSKVFADNYILSQKTSKMYITSYSNFGRIAALSSIHDNIYDVNLEKANLKKFVSNKERIFENE